MKNALRSIADYWRRSASFRFLARTASVAVVSYVVTATKQDDPIDLAALVAAVVISGGDALVKYLTPLEPFVGPSFAKPEGVEVPPPPAAVIEP